MSEIEKILSTNLSTYILDVLEIALCLPTDVLDKFISPDKGIYLSNCIKPILNFEDNRYYFEDGKEVLNLEDVKNTNSYILDNKDNVVITDKRISKIKSILLDQPNVPVTAIEFIIKDIENFLYNNTITNINIDINDLSLLLKNPKDLENVENEIYIYLKDIFSNLNDFINGDIYNIYELTEKSNILIINKKCDHRIIEYYKLREQISKTE